MTDRAVRVFCVALVVVALVGGVGAATQDASAQTTETIAGSQIAPDDVSMRVALTPEGTAAWTIEYRVRLDDENTTEAFESLQTDISNNETEYTAQFRDRMASTAATAENATGREMAIQDVSVAATRQQLPQDYGVVTYTFVWTNFAVADGGEIRAGDAIAGLFLDEETTLQISWPDGYTLDTAQPDPDDTRLGSRLVVWNGPLDFGPNEPTLVAVESTGDGVTTTPADDAGAGDGANPLRYDVVALVVVAAGAGGWLLYRRRGGRSHVGGDSTGADATGSSTATPTASTADTGAVPDSDGNAAETPEDATSDTTAESASAAAASGGETDETPPWEDELLSNEERVLALVEHEGGRIKQQEVARTLDWTDAKTSQVIRKMRDADKLDAFRLGRENVLVLPGESLAPGGPDDESGDTSGSEDTDGAGDTNENGDT
ncbi:helix-turn-helix transcriptional regulator [Halobellus salinisoli]|uniref:helix-turn-helix transcriptional regulator n=1 Tax=Halobellus salinisoli TaxID=3108500 RepID=UPI00300A4DE4